MVQIWLMRQHLFALLGRLDSKSQKNHKMSCGGGSSVLS